MQLPGLQTLAGPTHDAPEVGLDHQQEGTVCFSALLETHQSVETLYAVDGLQ